MRKGEIINKSELNNKIIQKIANIEKTQNAKVNEIRRYSNGSIGAYFGENNSFRFVGHDKKNEVEDKIKQFYQSKLPNQQAGSTKKKVSLKSAVHMLRKYYTEQYGK